MYEKLLSYYCKYQTEFDWQVQDIFTAPSVQVVNKQRQTEPQPPLHKRYFFFV